MVASSFESHKGSCCDVALDQIGERREETNEDLRCCRTVGRFAISGDNLRD